MQANSSYGMTDKMLLISQKIYIFFYIKKTLILKLKASLMPKTLHAFDFLRLIQKGSICYKTKCF